MKLRTMQVSVAVPSKTVRFAPLVNTSFIDTMSVATIVSVHGEESCDTPPKSTKAKVSGSFGNAEKRDFSQLKLKNPKAKRSKLIGYQLDQTVPFAVKKKQPSSSCLK